jgi:hypothetical protein
MLLSALSASWRTPTPTMSDVVGASTPFAILNGRVLNPGSDGKGWWDDRCAAMPIVLPPTDTQDKWRCFYYGRPDAS